MVEIDGRYDRYFLVSYFYVFSDYGKYYLGVINVYVKIILVIEIFIGYIYLMIFIIVIKMFLKYSI